VSQPVVKRNWRFCLGETPLSFYENPPRDYAHKVPSSSCRRKFRVDDLISAHGRVLVFLHLRAETVKFGCDCCVCLRDVFFEGFAPAEVNQGGDDQNFSQ
jgi:hypothetical protein